jgi:geranylgeranyl pyrophosphate synthase
MLDMVPTLIEPALARALDRIADPKRAPSSGHPLRAPDRLLVAMRYAVSGGGKRLRPLLVIGSAQALGASAEEVLPAACAVEFIHSYSLVHDDLPCLDDDAERRGRPSCHRQFDEATALLAGDALLTEALALIAEGAPPESGVPVPAERRVRATVELAVAAGAGGMIGGQHDDISLETADLSELQIRGIHARKTGCLFAAATAIGAIYAGGDETAVDKLRAFGADLGLGFQIVDDTLDGDGIAPSLGLSEARNQATKLTERALQRLEGFGAEADLLRHLAHMMAKRKS